MAALTEMEHQVYAAAFAQAVRDGTKHANLDTVDLEFVSKLRSNAASIACSAVAIFKDAQIQASVPAEVAYIQRAVRQSSPPTIKQKKFGQCGPACLAMVLKCELDAVVLNLERGGRDLATTGMTDQEMVEFLQDQDVECYISMERAPDQPAILTVPSLNHPGVLHYIYWDGKEYHDPGSGHLVYPKHAPRFGGDQIVCWSTAIIIGEPIKREFYYCRKCESAVDVVDGRCGNCETKCYLNSFTDTAIEALFCRWKDENGDLPAHAIELLFTRIEVLETKLAGLVASEGGV